jgi:hypothetical protein
MEETVAQSHQDNGDDWLWDQGSQDHGKTADGSPIGKPSASLQQCAEERLRKKSQTIIGNAKNGKDFRIKAPGLERAQSIDGKEINEEMKQGRNPELFFHIFSIKDISRDV